MKIIFISENGKRHARLSVNPWLHIATPLSLLFLVTGCYFYVNKQADFIVPPPQYAVGGLAENETFDHPASRSQFVGTIVRNAPGKNKEKPYLKQTSGFTSSASEVIHKSVQLSSIPVNSGIISSRYGFRRDPFNGKTRLHQGVDIAAKPGTGIHTLASGFVVYAGRKGGYGNMIEIQHDKSLLSRYAHLSNMLVTQGNVVQKGDLIAKMGSSGRSTGPHLHLEVLKNGRNVDPELYFDGSLTNYQ